MLELVTIAYIMCKCLRFRFYAYWRVKFGVNMKHRQRLMFLALICIKKIRLQAIEKSKTQKIVNNYITSPTLNSYSSAGST